MDFQPEGSLILKKKSKNIIVSLLLAVLLILSTSCGKTGPKILDGQASDVLSFPEKSYGGEVTERDWILKKIEPGISYLRNERNSIEDSVVEGTDEKGNPTQISVSTITNPQTGKSVRKVEQQLESGFTLGQYYYGDTLFLEDMLAFWNIAWADDNFLLGTSAMWTFYYDTSRNELEYICYPFDQQIPKAENNSINYDLFSNMDIDSSGLVSMDFERRQLVYWLADEKDLSRGDLILYNWKTGEEFTFHTGIALPEGAGAKSIFTYFHENSLFYSVRKDTSNNAVAIYELDIPSKTSNMYMTTGDETTFLGGSRYIAFSRFFTARNEEQNQSQEPEHPQEFIIHDLAAGENVFRLEGSYTATLYNRYVLFVQDGDFKAFDLEDRQMYRFNTEKLFEDYPGKEIMFSTIIQIDDEQFLPDYAGMLSAKESPSPQ